MAQGALDAAGVRRVWAEAGLQRAAYRGGGISCGLAHILLFIIIIIIIKLSRPATAAATATTTTTATA